MRCYWIYLLYTTIDNWAILQSPYNWLVCHPLYTLNNQCFFHGSIDVWFAITFASSPTPVDRKFRLAHPQARGPVVADPHSGHVLFNMLYIHLYIIYTYLYSMFPVPGVEQCIWMHLMCFGWAWLSAGTKAYTSIPPCKAALVTPLHKSVGRLVPYSLICAEQSSCKLTRIGQRCI